jgi:poly(A) polymerase
MELAQSTVESTSPEACLEFAVRAAHGEELAPPAAPPSFVGLAPTALRECMDGVLLGRHADRGLEALFQFGLLSELLPEVVEIVGFGDNENRHKDVWKHTKQVVTQCVPELAVRWAALLHDIGKARTRSVSPDGKVHFLHHPEVGARMFDKLERRLKLFADDLELKKKIRFLVVHHQRAHQYEATWTDSAIRRFGREMGDHLVDLMALSRADMTTKRRDKRRRYMFQLKELKERIAALLEEDSRIPPLPKGVGDALMKAFDIPPSRRIGEVKRALEQLVEAGSLQPHQPSEYYLDYVSQHRSDFEL